MEPKKSKKANLENKRSLFFQTGLILAMGATLAAFEYKSAGVKIEVSATPISGFDEVEMIDNTFREEKKVVPPKPVVREMIEIIPDDGIDDIVDLGAFDTDNLGDIIDYLPEATEDIPFVSVQFKPKYKGGDESNFWKDMNSKLVYPPLAQEMGLEGDVIVSFVINKKGELTKIQILRSSEPVFNDEVIRALKKSDIWTPGKQLDKPVSVSYTMPFKFRLTR